MADSVTNLVSRLSTRMNNAMGDRDKPDYLTRDIGGHFRNNQPYISGYFQVMFGLPEELFLGPENASIASKWLHSTCESFTPHSQTNNKVDIMGQGQLGSSFVASTTITREVTLAFREYQNMPILNIIRSWASVFDPHVGASPLDGNRFVPKNYKGWLAVAQMKPTGARNDQFHEDDIEECYIYQGVFPTNIPVDTAGAGDITANDTVQLSCTFSFDGAPLTSAEPNVTSQVISLLNGLQMMGISQDAKSTYEHFWSTGTTTTTQWGSHDGVNDSGADPNTKFPTQKVGA